MLLISLSTSSKRRLAGGVSALRPFRISKPLPVADRIGDVTLVLLEDDVFDCLASWPRLKAEFAVVWSRVRVSEYWRARSVNFSPLRMRVHQILGLLLRRGHFGRAAVAGGDEDLAQGDHLLADELRLVLVVILLHLGFRDDDVAVDLFADARAASGCWFLHLQLEILEAFARLLLNPVVELVRIGDLLCD